MKGNVKYYISSLMLFYSCLGVETAKSHFKAAKKYEKESDFISALTHINSAIRLDSNNAVLYIYRGKINNYLKNDSLSIYDYIKATSLEPQNSLGYFQMGISYSILGKDDSAIICYNKAIEAQRVGDFYFEKNIYSEYGLEESDYAVSKRDIIFQRAISYYEIGSDSLSMEDFNYLLKIKHNVGTCNFYIGVMLITSGQNIGCKYLQNAIKNGEVRAREYLQNFCK